MDAAACRPTYTDVDRVLHEESVECAYASWSLTSLKGAQISSEQDPLSPWHTANYGTTEAI
jgi:hypothetical protein